MTAEPDELPGVLAIVAEACGSGAALTLASAFGGVEIYIPTPDRLGEDHPLALALGVAAARTAAKALGAGSLTIPLGPTSQKHKRRAIFARLKKDGASHRRIARALGVHQRTVARYDAAQPDLSQPDLFERLQGKPK